MSSATFHCTRGVRGCPDASSSGNPNRELPRRSWPPFRSRHRLWVGRSRRSRACGLRRAREAPDDGIEGEWNDLDIKALSELMPDPESDIYDHTGPERDLEKLRDFGMSGHSAYDEIMDQYLREMAGSSLPGIEEAKANAKANKEFMKEKGYDLSDFVGTEQEVKDARDNANFHAKAAWKDGIVGNAVLDAVHLNNLNMQRAVNRYKMTKEMGRWVEYFEKAEAEKGYAVRKVPAWVKAVHLINWDFENLNETHRLEDMDDDEEDEEDDDDEEEGADDEEGDGLMPGTLMWELPRAEIAGKPELQEEGYPAAVIAAANALAEDLLGDCSNKFVDGYVKPGTFDFIKIKQMPPPVEIYKGIEPRDEEDEEEAEMTEEEKEMLIAATDAPERTYLPPDTTEEDETTALLWNVMIPSEGPRETAMMSDILGGFKTKEEKVEEFEDGLGLDDDFDTLDLEDMDDLLDRNS